MHSSNLSDEKVENCIDSTDPMHTMRVNGKTPNRTISHTSCSAKKPLMTSLKLGGFDYLHNVTCTIGLKKYGALSGKNWISNLVQPSLTQPSLTQPSLTQPFPVFILQNIRINRTAGLSLSLTTWSYNNNSAPNCTALKYVKISYLNNEGIGHAVINISK